MAPEAEKERSPVLATCLGCLGMSLLPLAALAVLVGSVYLYFDSSEQAKQDQEQVERERARQAQDELERQRKADQAQPLSAGEQTQLHEAVKQLTALDETLRKKAEGILARLSARNPQAVCDALAAMLSGSKNPQQINAATGFLCRFHRDAGLAIVCAQLRTRRDDHVFLRAVREGVMSVENLTLRERALNEIVTTLERSNSVYAKNFFDL